MSSGWEDALSLSATAKHRSERWLGNDLTNQWYFRYQSRTDLPLYKSYFFGLDQVGLDSGEDSEDSIDMDSDIYHIPDRTKSAPLPKTSDKRSSRKSLSLRHKSCFSLKVI